MRSASDSKSSVDTSAGPSLRVRRLPPGSGRTFGLSSDLGTSVPLSTAARHDTQALGPCVYSVLLQPTVCIQASGDASSGAPGSAQMAGWWTWSRRFRPGVVARTGQVLPEMNHCAVSTAAWQESLDIWENAWIWWTVVVVDQNGMPHAGNSNQRSCAETGCCEQLTWTVHAHRTQQAKDCQTLQDQHQQLPQQH